MKSGAVRRAVEVLLIEDSPGDARLAQEAFREGTTDSNVHVVDNCRAALQFLRQQDKYANQPRPDLVLLDLNLRGERGLDVLKEIKGDEQLRSIPVVILTTSTHDRDIQESYQQGANCYICKGLELDEFIQVIRALEYFWFSVAKLPS